MQSPYDVFFLKNTYRHKYLTIELGKTTRETMTEPTPPNDSSAPKKDQPTIHLDQFLKTCGVATGGQAKVMIQAGEVLVNNEIETRRRKQLRLGDEVTLHDVIYVVSLGEPTEDDDASDNAISD
ncbi:MAG: RNA-binding S4 domain-containing protein [Mariniblastus sp.]|nr:RNA-binding S4 domain-containing protein [Mariniblastus sp.]